MILAAIIVVVILAATLGSQDQGCNELDGDAERHAAKGSGDRDVGPGSRSGRRAHSHSRWTDRDTTAGRRASYRDSRGERRIHAASGNDASPNRPRRSHRDGDTSPVKGDANPDGGEQ